MKGCLSFGYQLGERETFSEGSISTLLDIIYIIVWAATKLLFYKKKKVRLEQIKLYATPSDDKTYQ